MQNIVEKKPFQGERRAATLSSGIFTQNVCVPESFNMIHLETDKLLFHDGPVFLFQAPPSVQLQLSSAVEPTEVLRANSSAGDSLSSRGGQSIYTNTV